MSVADPVMNFEANVVGTFRVLDAARQAGVERVVLASTGGALIGDALPPVNEYSLPKPISPYGASKLAGEGYAHAFAKSFGMRTVALRFANVYGPWSGHKKGAMTVFFRALHTGQPIVIYGDGTSSRDYTHVDDIAHALQLALEGDVPGGTVLHIASGVETTITELADLCRNAAGQPDHPVEYQPRRVGEVDRNFATYDLAKQVLGYTPAISREDGIGRPGSGTRSTCSPLAGPARAAALRIPVRRGPARYDHRLMDTIRVALAEDNVLLREGISRLIAHERRLRAGRARPPTCPSCWP